MGTVLCFEHQQEWLRSREIERIEMISEVMTSFADSVADCSESVFEGIREFSAPQIVKATLYSMHSREIHVRHHYSYA
jgi:hypothetical protein